ncbi:hypothetical protein [Mesorhizobium sp. M7A.F.Ca.US.007.01.1.1]|nr:hypothetical protein [Mesorhizobium sp. M7A.F.Ca.US.007.01.1.1]
MRLVFAPNTPPETKEVRNCAVLAGGTPPPGNQQKANNQQPAALPPPTASNANGLAVQASGVPASCSPKAGTCEFEVKVTNTSANAVTGPFRVIQTLSVGTQSQAKNSPTSLNVPAGLQCKPDGRELDCQQPELTLAPGESRSMKIAFTIDTTEGGEADFVQSKAAVTFGPLAGEATAAIAFDEPLNNKLPEPGAPEAGGNPPDGDAGGQPAAPACATLPLDPDMPVQTGPVVISKKGPASCPLKGPCTFEITLTNTTDAPVPGPIPFTDTIDVAGAKLSDDALPPPFACEKGGPPVKCSFGNAATALGPKESRSVSLRFDLELPAGTRTVKNCAMTSPAAVPQKKAELTVPMSRRPLITYAAFRSASLAEGKGLLHFIDNPGGNIGGVSSVTKDCTKWGMKKNGFVVMQSNGLQISFNHMEVDPNGNAIGQASFFPKDGGGAISGVVRGTISGTRFTLNVTWNTGDTGLYKGDITADGSVQGDHINRAGVIDTFRNDGSWWTCKASRFCEGYAGMAMLSAKTLGEEGCRPTGPEIRWSMDNQKHIDFCMARASTADPMLEAENKARFDRHVECAREKQVRLTCPTLVKSTVALNDQMKALNCKNAISFTPKTVMDMCVRSPLVVVAVERSFQNKLAACKAELAANGNAGAGGADPGADEGDGVGGGGKVREPAPEQCAVVNIEEVDPPGGGGQVDPQASTAGPLSLVKTFTTCVENRCVFNVTISNTSDAEVKGPVEFTDDVTGDGAVFNSATVSAASDPKFNCARQGQGFICSNPAVTLAAKSSVSITLTADLGKGIGAVKEMKNCATLKGAAAPSCATARLLQPAPQPEQPKNLALAHNPAVAQCSDIGGGCVFTTSVSNPADAPEFNGPLSFTVHLSQPDGSAFPNIAMEGGGEAASVPGVTAPISCKKDGNDVTCTSAVTAKIQPGKTVPVSMTFKPGSGTNATAIKTCASFAGGEQTCASIPLVKGPLLRAQKFTAATSCVPSCAFGILLKNVGTDAASGPFVIKEDFKPITDTTIETVDGDFACSTTNGTVGCISTNKGTNVLKPGETLSGRVLVKTSRVSPTYTNCIDYNPAANAKPSPFDRDFAGRCVTIKDEVHKGANLMVEVLPPNGKPNGVGECGINEVCRFRVSVKSNGSDTVVGPPPFNAKVRNGIVQFINAGLTVKGTGACSKKDGDTQTVACQSAVSMPPETFLDADAVVIAGATWKKNDTLTLCATVPPVDSNPNDNEGCASVKLDPFSVKVTKTGDQSCTLGGDCHFALRLFNPGPIDHNAPVTISDKLTGLASAQIVSITPPLPCATQPTQIPFSCTSPGPVRLDLDAPEGSEFGPRNFNMVVRLPSDASAGRFSNCADVSDGTPGINDQSCKTVSLTPPVQTCQGGMVLANGICACPPNTRWDGKSCSGTGGASTSKPITPEAAPVLAVPSATCKFGMILAGNGLCACPANTKWTGKACEAAGPGSGGIGLIKQAPQVQARVCPADRPMGAYPNCCPQGTEYRNGKCRSQKTAPIEVKCGSGLVKDARTGRCIACKRGSHAEGNACVLNRIKQQPGICPADRPVGAYPNCCPQGTEYRNGKCRSPQPAQVKCRRSQVLDAATGVCVDRARQRFCPADRPVGAYPNCCPERYQFGRGKCRPMRDQQQEQQSCPANRPVGVYPNCCPEGYQFGRGRCRPVRDQQQEQQSCPANRPVGVYPNCCPEGYQFGRGRCRMIRDQNQQPQQPDQGTRPVRKKTCPDGTVVYGRYSKCPNDNPAPQPQPQPQPQQQQCRGDQVSTSSGCVCPTGTRESSGQCIDRVN